MYYLVPTTHYSKRSLTTCNNHFLCTTPAPAAEQPIGPRGLPPAPHATAPAANVAVPPPDTYAVANIEPSERERVVKAVGLLETDTALSQVKMAREELALFLLEVRREQGAAEQTVNDLRGEVAQLAVDIETERVASGLDRLSLVSQPPSARRSCTTAVDSAAVVLPAAQTTLQPPTTATMPGPAPSTRNSVSAPPTRNSVAAGNRKKSMPSRETLERRRSMSTQCVL